MSFVTPAYFWISNLHPSHQIFLNGTHFSLIWLFRLALCHNALELYDHKSCNHVLLLTSYLIISWFTFNSAGKLALLKANVVWKCNLRVEPSDDSVFSYNISRYSWSKKWLYKKSVFEMAVQALAVRQFKKIFQNDSSLFDDSVSLCHCCHQNCVQVSFRFIPVCT